MTLAYPKPKDAEGRITLGPYEYRKLRLQVYAEQDKCCAHCGRQMYRPTDGELHHISPRKMGGGSRDDSRANIEMICKSCHRREHNQ